MLTIENHGGQPKVKLAEPGDIIYARTAVPNIDYISIRHPHGKHFDARLLSDYLAFLESVVLHERIFAVYSNVEQTPDPEISDTEAFRSLNTRYAIKGEPDISKAQIFDNLRKKGILFEAEARHPEFSASDVMQRYSRARQTLLHVQDLKRRLRRFHMGGPLLRKIVEWQYTFEIGTPLFLTEFAAEAQKPLRLSDKQIGIISSVLHQQQLLQSGVIDYLKQRLDSGAHREAKRLQDLGHSTIFPSTPIANEILQGAQSPGDLIDVALDLRTQYKGFRKNMLRLENELFSPTLTLKRKFGLVKYLDELADEIWPHKVGQFQQITHELSCVTSLALSFANPVGLDNVGVNIANVTSLPWRQLRTQLRRRKIVALLRTKETFLSSKPSTGKISKLFGASPEVVLRSLRENERPRI